MSRLRISPELCLFALLVVPVYGQIDRGMIQGTVTDPQNATVAGAKITLSNPATGATFDTTTEAGGSFTFVGLVAGQYKLTCENSGFKKFVQEAVPVDVGRTTSLNILLVPGTVYESVTVKEEAPLLDAETSDVGTSVTRREIMNLPVPLTSDSRNPLSFVLLTPGVAVSIPGPTTPDLRLNISGERISAVEAVADAERIGRSDVAIL